LLTLQGRGRERLVGDLARCGTRCSKKEKKEELQNARIKLNPLFNRIRAFLFPRCANGRGAAKRGS
jgi:hypothetical protein